VIVSPRATWDETWMRLAHDMALRSLCERRQIGAVVVSVDNAYSVVGYNGPPRGLSIPQRTFSVEPTSCTTWCDRGRQSSSIVPQDYDNCVTIHAETNALIRADYSRIQGGSLYVTSFPCWDCAKNICNSGVIRVFSHLDPSAEAHRKPYVTKNFMERCGLEVTVV
jgi:dCMP deaminase